MERRGGLVARLADTPLAPHVLVRRRSPRVRGFPHRPPKIDNPTPMRHYGTGWMNRAAGAGRTGPTGLQGELT